MGNWRLIIAVALSGMMMASGAQPALAGFQPQQTFDTGFSPLSVAAADLNGDGRLDLAVANFSSATVGVLLNTTPTGAATPSFAPQQTFDTEFAPASVAAADLNGDGRPDLAVANRGSFTVSVLLNTTAVGAGIPTFLPQQTFDTGAAPFSVAAADLNGDGKPDLAVANLDGDTVSVLLNTTAAGATTPTFAAQETFATGLDPISVAAADLNGDGKPDLAVTNVLSNTVSVLLNATAAGAGTPTFLPQQTFSVGLNPGSVAAADLNGDGRPDLAVTNFNNHTVGVLLNTTASGAGTPTFAPQQTFDTGRNPASVAAADLNGDGKPDLTVANLDGDTVSVLLNIMAAGATIPSFATQPTFGVGDAPASAAAADLNGDGKPDLAVANRDGGTVSVLPGVPSGSLQLTNPGTVVEADGTAVVALTRTGSTDGQVSAIVSVTGGAAMLGQDFTFPAPQTVTWADGDGADKAITIPLVQDQVDEDDETIQLTLSLPANPFGATLGAQTTANVTIADDDPPVTLGIANVTLAEGSGGTRVATFTVTRTGSTERAVAVQYATADGSAQAGSDYEATSGTLTFAPNEAAKTIEVLVRGDALPEPDETFTVALSNPTNATIATPTATGSIQNDDAACAPRPRVTQAVAAGGGALTVRVEPTPLNTSARNPLHQIRFGALQNATVTLNGQPVTSGQIVALPPNTASVEVVVRRAAAGQPTTVPFTVVDGCGEWQTLVGGGASAGF